MMGRDKLLFGTGSFFSRQDQALLGLWSEVSCFQPAGCILWVCELSFQSFRCDAFSFFHGTDTTRSFSLPFRGVVFKADEVGVNFLALMFGEPTDLLLNFQHGHPRKTS